MSAAIGSVLSNARTATATSSNGLAYMWEMLHIASSMRAPIIMELVCRSISGPLNIHNDHSDAMGMKDTGWIMLFSKNNQDVYDNTIIGTMIAENSNVLLPIAICQDGFITSHSIENIEILEDEIDIIDVSKNDIVNKELNSISAKENELYELVSNLLRVKNNSISVSRIRKNWLNKFKYVYKIALLLQNNLDIVEEISNPTFTEVYDYDLERIGLYSNLRNRIYSAHIYVYLKILVFAILYNDTEYFDAVYKIMKYKILIDESKNFKVLSDQYSKKQIKNVINFMKNISDNYDNKDSFELDKIERLVKIKKI